MTRSHKANDVPHNHPEAIAAFQEHSIPKFFGKTGHVDEDPKKTKKNGGGKGNWGRSGDEIQDLEISSSLQQTRRRRSNSNSKSEDLFKSKFDTNEDEPVFEELEEEVEEDAHTSSTSSAASSQATSHGGGEVGRAGVVAGAKV